MIKQEQGLYSNQAFETIACPICRGRKFKPVLEITPRQFLSKERINRYNLNAIGCDLDTVLTYQRCLSCGYTGTNPRLRMEYSNVVYNDMKVDFSEIKGWAFDGTSLAALYQTYHKWHAINLLETVLSLFYDRFSKTKNEGYKQLRLLDIGCGYGHILELARVFRVDGYGIDIDESRLTYCQSIGLKAYKPRDLPDGQFDIIISTSVVEHAFDLHTYFEMANSRLSRGGIFALTGLTPEIITVERQRGVYKNVAPIEHLNLIPQGALYNLAEQHNLVPVSTGRLLKAIKTNIQIAPRFAKYLFQKYVRFDIWRGSFMELMAHHYD